MLIFVGISILNVVLATIKSIVTIKGSKLSASLLNGIYFGYYNIVMIFTVASDNGLTVFQKVVITALTNFVGVFLVKLGIIVFYIGKKTVDGAHIIAAEHNFIEFDFLQIFRCKHIFLLVEMVQRRSSIRAS